MTASAIRLILKFAISLAMCLFVIGSVPLFVLAGMLLVHAETCQGRLFAIAVILGLASPVLLWVVTYLKRKRFALIVALTPGILALVLLGIDYSITASGKSLPDSCIRSCFTGTTSYGRASMANLVPEIDQLVLGTYVMSHLDRLMDQPSTLELREQTLSVYGEMRQAPDFECLGSVMNLCYRDLFLGDRPIGHFYEYVPTTSTKERLPVILFLHGSLGNFKGYLWVWKHLADKLGYAIVAPTFGAGNWNVDGGVDAIERARQYCVSNPRFDPSRIYLAGLSNGGIGVSLGATRSPNSYRGLIYISPVLDPDVLQTNEFRTTWKDKPILVIHGDSDNRIGINYVSRTVGTLEKNGLHVEHEFYPGQTHFLFFTIREKVLARIAEWLSTN